LKEHECEVTSDGHQVGEGTKGKAIHGVTFSKIKDQTTANRGHLFQTMEVREATVADCDIAADGCASVSLYMRDGIEGKFAIK
jgi:hypothetical protein